MCKSFLPDDIEQRVKKQNGFCFPGEIADKSFESALRIVELAVTPRGTGQSECGFKVIVVR
ncbi:hypothetical protein GCM10009414_08980 [Tatumella terrea]